MNRAKNLKICRPILGQYVYTKDEFTDYSNELFGLVAEGRLKLSTWDKDYELTTEGIRQTQIDIMSRKTSGKLLVKIA
jgi:NADPH2:quinone reductase